MKDLIFLNGKFLPAKEAQIPMLEPGFLYGWGVFETMRSYNNRIVYLGQHLKRLRDSSNLIIIKIPYSLNKIKEIIQALVRMNELKDAYIRITLWKSVSKTGILIAAKKYHAYPKEKYERGFKVTVSSLRHNEVSLLSRIKSTSYLLYQLVYQEAREKGFDEALILNSRGYLTEGSRSNVFIVKDNHLFTPSLGCGCLPGISRQIVFDMAEKYNLKIYEGNLTPYDLSACEGAFLTNSLIGVMPLGKFERQVVPKSKLVKSLVQKYNRLLKSGN